MAKKKTKNKFKKGDIVQYKSLDIRKLSKTGEVMLKPKDEYVRVLWKTKHPDFQPYEYVGEAREFIEREFYEVFCNYIEKVK